MTAVLVALLIGVYLHIVSLGAHADVFLQAHGAVPNRFLSMLQWRHPYVMLYGLVPVVTAIFLHANWMHVAINALLLLLFGPSVEDRLGHYRFLLLFLFSGVVAIIAEALVVPDSHTALVGAQGAVAGVGGACILISPRSRIPTMVRGLELPWAFAPVCWLMFAILASVSPLSLPLDVGVVGLPYLFLAFAAGAALGPLYRHQRPILLRG